MSNRAVALMRQPAVRRRLRSELAALPHQLVSYEDLLAFFINYGCSKAIVFNLGGMEASFQDSDIMTAIRLAAELLPQLAPDNPRFLYNAATAAAAAETIGNTTLGACAEGSLR